MPVFVSTTYRENGTLTTEVVEELLANGIYNIELGSIHKEEADLRDKLLSFNGNYITHNFFPPDNSRIVLNLASIDESIRRGSIEFIKNALDFAVSIKAKIYTVHPGFLVHPKGEGIEGGSYDFKFDIDKDKLNIALFNRCNELFVESLKELDYHIEDKPIRIAVETQGAIEKKDILLFSKPADYKLFFEAKFSEKIGINLNLAHTHLASIAWDFDKTAFLNEIKDSVIAIEASHNDGTRDDHVALKEGGWYFDDLQLFKGWDIPMIVETRFTSMRSVKNSVRMLNDI